MNSTTQIIAQAMQNARAKSRIFLSRAAKLTWAHVVSRIPQKLVPRGLLLTASFARHSEISLQTRAMILEFARVITALRSLMTRVPSDCIPKEVLANAYSILPHSIHSIAHRCPEDSRFGAIGVIVLTCIETPTSAAILQRSRILRRECQSSSISQWHLTNRTVSRRTGRLLPPTCRKEFSA